MEFLGGTRGNSALSGPMAMLTYNGSPLMTRMVDKPAFEGERLVVISSPFFHTSWRKVTATRPCK